MKVTTLATRTLQELWYVSVFCYNILVNLKGGMTQNFIIRNAEVREDIALVYGNRMAAECRLPSFVIIILTISLFCIALF